MIHPKTPLLALTVGLLLGATASAPAARAEDLPSQSPLVPLTPDQLAAFADLVGDSTEVVSLRLLSDPGLLPLAADALDEHALRQRRGRTMSNLGLAGFGVGVVLGILGGVLASKWDSSRCGPNDESGCDNGAHLFPLILGVPLAIGGLIVGGIGMSQLNSPGDAETLARKRYDPNFTPPRRVMPAPSYSAARAIGPAGKALSLQLLSFTF